MTKHKPTSQIILGDTDNVFSITCKGISASKLVIRGKYDHVNNSITEKLIPIKKHAPLSRTIELVKFDRNLTSKEVLAKFAQCGLKQPTREDALVFGIAYPEKQRKHRIVFLHAPIRIINYYYVFVLHELDRERYLDLCWFDNKWHQSCVFAAVRTSS